MVGFCPGCSWAPWIDQFPTNCIFTPRPQRGQFGADFNKRTIFFKNQWQSSQTLKHKKTLADKCQNAGLSQFKICKSRVNDNHHCRSLPGLPWGPPPWSLRRGDPLLLQPRTLPSLKEKAKSVFCKLVISASYSIKQSGSSPVDSVNTLVWRDFESERGRCWLNDDRDKCALACYSPQIQIQIQTIVGKTRRHACAIFFAYWQLDTQVLFLQFAVKIDI